MGRAAGVKRKAVWFFLACLGSTVDPVGKPVSSVCRSTEFNVPVNRTIDPWISRSKQQIRFCPF
jgi:hypothetical protein